jgi:4'-phosphopantetheinyl transferase
LLVSALAAPRRVGIGCQRYNSSEVAKPRRAFPGSVVLSDQVHVIRIVLDSYGDGAELIPLLDDEERARAARFVQSRNRRRFIAAHAVTRVVLGRCLQVPADGLRFRIGARGKPAISGPVTSLEYSLSHSGERALVAVTRDRALGIDIEQIRPMDTLQVSARFFSPMEHAALASIGPAHLLPAFFRCWTRKESFVKATGDGLSRSLRRFAVSLDEQVANALVASDDPRDAARWTILPVEIDTGYAAAVTVSGAGCPITCWDAPDLTPSF